MAAPITPTGMADYTPTDRPSRNTRQQTRLQPRVKQLRAQYPLHLLPILPHLSDKDLQEYIENYEQELLTAAAPNSTTKDLGFLALASLGGAWGHAKYLEKHYLPHLHCITDYTTTCKSCSEAFSDYDGDDSDCESESEYELEFHRENAQREASRAEAAAQRSS